MLDFCFPVCVDSSFVGVSKICKYPGSSTEHPFDVYLDEINSAVNISMASTMTTELPSGRCYFDILLTYGYADTTTKKFVSGTIIVQDTSSL